MISLLLFVYILACARAHTMFSKNVVICYSEALYMPYGSVSCVVGGSASEATAVSRPSAVVLGTSTMNSTATTRYRATLPPSRPVPSSTTQPEPSIYDSKPLYRTLANPTTTYHTTSVTHTDVDHHGARAKGQ